MNEQSKVKYLEDRVRHLEEQLEKAEEGKRVWKQRCFAETTACAKFWIETLISEVGTRMGIDDIDAYVNYRIDSPHENIRGGEVAVYYNAIVSEDVRKEFTLEREREATDG